MQQDISFPKLFTPGFIGTMELKNRLILAPIVRYWADMDGSVSDRHVEHFAEIAKGGVALMIVESSYIELRGQGFDRGLGLYSDKLIPGLKRLADAAHENGSKIAMQVYHAGRQRHVGEPNPTPQPVAPSAIPCPVMGSMPRELTSIEIDELIERFVEGARRSKKAGFDAIEIHGAHGYLINEFLSPYTNKRIDQYGGSLENRVRFPVEIIKRIKQDLGVDFPVIFRISGDEYLEEGLHIEDTKLIARKLEEAGVDAIHVSAGIYESGPKGGLIQPMDMPRGLLVPLAEQIKQVVNTPVIAVGRINNPGLAEDILKDQKADFIAMGRPLLADPELPKKAQEGRVDEICMCVACLQACLDRINWFNPHPEGVSCLVNPAVGREKAFTLKPAEHPKKVLVIGGGPAGLEAARVAAIRGHKVMLYEKKDRLGGQLNLASAAPHKEEFATFVAYLATQMEKLGVKVEMGKEVTPDIVEESQPDVVIAALGARPLIAEDIPGSSGENVVTAWDVLAGRVDLQGTVIVAGGGEVGCEAAELLAEKGNKIRIVEMLEEVAMNMGDYRRLLLMGRLEEAKDRIQIFTRTKIKEITENGVVVEQNGQTYTIEGKTVVLAQGAVPERGLLESLKGKVVDLREIGDCVSPRRALDAVYEGAFVGREI